jgi:mycothiol synthase
VADPSPPVASRPLREGDWPRVRELLIDVLPRAAPGFVWEVRRWDGWRWYAADPAWDPRREEMARIWEAADGRLVAAAFPEGRGDVSLQVDPAFRRLEGEMLSWAEQALAVHTGDGRRLTTAVRDYDVGRQALLARRGWRGTDDWAVTFWLRFGDVPIVVPPIAAGYRLRSMRPGDADDHARLADVLNAAFLRSSHDAAESMIFERHAPGFRPDLHLFAEAPDGSFAAHVAVTLEPVDGLAIVEPVCTHPEHRRRGLAKALILEGLERARALGARLACVDTGDEEGQHRLYASCGFTERYVAHAWEWRG